MSERFQLALVSPGLDGESAAAQFWSKLLPLLREEIDVDVFEAGDRVSEGAQSIATLYPKRYQQIVYVVDDLAECGFMARAIRGLGGVVDLFSWDLPKFAVGAWPELGRKGMKSFVRAVREGGLAEAREWRKPDSNSERCFNRTVVRHGDAFIVRDESLGDRIREERNENTAVGAIRDPELAPARVSDRSAVRDELGLPSEWRNSQVVAWFSPLHPRKRELLLKAVTMLREQNPELQLLGVGRAERSRADYHMADTSETWRVIEACDVAVHFPHEREQVTGEVSEALIHGRCVVTSQTARFDYPKEAVRVCEEDPAAIAEALTHFLAAKEARESAEAGAVEFMNETRRWKHVARLYSQFLSSFPAPRAARKSLIAARLREVERRSQERASE